MTQLVVTKADAQNALLSALNTRQVRITVVAMIQAFHDTGVAALSERGLDDYGAHAAIALFAGSLLEVSAKALALEPADVVNGMAAMKSLSDIKK